LIATVFEESEEPRMTDSLSTAQPFVCGGLSACFASSIVHPVDLAKVRLQLFAVEHAGKARPSFPQIITTMVKKEGFVSIYSGLSAALARQCVYGTARIGLHRTFSDLLQKRNDGKPLNFGYKALR
jgi:solute carrier family 25 (mitochondrial oxoglutarate transporter), member 11